MTDDEKSLLRLLILALAMCLLSSTAFAASAYLPDPESYFSYVQKAVNDDGSVTYKMVVSSLFNADSQYNRGNAWLEDYRELLTKREYQLNFSGQKTLIGATAYFYDYTGDAYVERCEHPWAGIEYSVMLSLTKNGAFSITIAPGFTLIDYKEPVPSDWDATSGATN